MSEEANLVAAILRRDFDAAIDLIEQMKWTSNKWARAVQEGRSIAFPLAPLPPLDEPEPFPVPGHLPGSFLGGPHITMPANKGK